MELSLLLAKVIGVGLVLVAASMLFNRKNIDLLFDAYKSAAAVYITGIVEIFLGLSLVISHNIWAADFRVIITIIGWMLLVRGVGRIFAPARIPQLLGRFKTMGSFFVPLLVFILLIGAYLAYAGFTG